MTLPVRAAPALRSTDLRTPAVGSWAMPFVVVIPSPYPAQRSGEGGPRRAACRGRSYSRLASAPRAPIAALPSSATLHGTTFRAPYVAVAQANLRDSRAPLQGA